MSDRNLAVVMHRARQCIQTLAYLAVCMYGTQANAACSGHDHLCTFHALGAKVDVTLPPGVTFNLANSLVMYGIGKDPVTGAPSTADFDTEGKMPTYTGDKFLAGDPVNYNISAGPYIVNTTTYGAAHPPGTWSVPGDSGLQVTPSQYKNTFNANTAVAKHTGDFNGGENGNIPGATGCPNMPGAANCEAVVVTGNVPSGIYEQKVRLFNFYGVPDPKVDLQVGAYVTGQLVIVTKSHDVKEVASFPKLEGDKSTTPTYQYEVYNRQFDPHAAGVAIFDRMNWGKVRTVGDEYTRNGHRFLTQVQDSTTTRTKVYGDTGWATQNTWVNSPKVVAPVHLGPVPQINSNVPGLFDPLAAFKKDSTPWNAAISMSDTKVPYAPGIDVAAIEASNALAGWNLNQPNSPYMFDPNYSGAMTGPGTLSDGRQAWIPNPNYIAPISDRYIDLPFTDKKIDTSKLTWARYIEEVKKTPLGIEMPWAEGSKQLQEALGEVAVNNLVEGNSNWENRKYVAGVVDYTTAWGAGILEATHKVFTPDSAGTTAVVFLPVVSKIKPIGGAKGALNASDDYVNILSPEDSQHIISGNGRGSGGHMYPGQPGKTTFPQGWPEGKILHNVGDVVTSPTTQWYAQTGNGGLTTAAGKPARWIAWEIRDGVSMRVVFEPATGRVVTAFPDSAPAIIGLNRITK